MSVDVLNDTERKARAAHQCSACCGTIRPGERYHDQTCAYEGRVYHWREHLLCRQLVSLTGVLDHDDEVSEGWLLEEVGYGDPQESWPEDVRAWWGVVARGEHREVTP